jgi:hypothetical protein
MENDPRQTGPLQVAPTRTDSTHLAPTDPTHVAPTDAELAELTELMTAVPLVDGRIRAVAGRRATRI